MKQLIREPASASGSVTAITLITSAIGPLVMNVFDPFRIQNSPSCTARVLIPAASDPASGSVIANAPTHSPEHSFGSHVRFWSSVPCSQIGTAPMQTCAPSDSNRPESRPPSSSASSARFVVMMSAPEPPYCSGIGSPHSPNSPHARQTSGSQRPSRSRPSASGATTFSANTLTDLRNASCSSVKAKLRLIVAPGYCGFFGRDGRMMRSATARAPFGSTIRMITANAINPESPSMNESRMMKESSRVPTFARIIARLD